MSDTAEIATAGSSGVAQNPASCETIPGTHILTSPSAVIPHPTASCHPDDPLNWSRTRKHVSMFCMALFTLSSGVATASIYSILVPISEQTSVSLATLNQGTGYMFLFLGLGCLFWQPMGQQYGKRIVYIVSLLLTIASQIWSAHASSSSPHWIGSKIFQGIVQAPIESMCAVTISDVFYEHERGRWVGLYAFSLMFSSYVAPVLAAPIAQNQGWQWVLYWGAIFCAVATVILFFCFEETNFTRDGLQLKTSGPSMAKDEESGKEGDDVNVCEHESKKMTLETSELRGTYSKKSYRAKLALLDPPRPMMLPAMFLRPFKLLLFPVIVYSGFLYGIGLVWFNVLNATASMILSAPPYNFPMTSVGMAYLSPSICSGIIGWGGGYLSDWIKVFLARRNGGLSEPEHRLWIILVYLILVPPALVLWGVGAANEVHWMGLVIAMGLIGGSGTICATASVTYAIDSYREISSDTMVTLIIIRNTMSFGIGYGINPWLESQGLAKACGQAAGACVICVLTFLIYVVYGKRFRQQTATKYWKMIQESIDNGMVY